MKPLTTKELCEMHIIDAVLRKQAMDTFVGAAVHPWVASARRMVAYYAEMLPQLSETGRVAEGYRKSARLAGWKNN